MNFQTSGYTATHNRWKSLIGVAFVICAVMVTTILIYIPKDVATDLVLDIIIFVVLMVTFTMGVGGLASYVFNHGKS